MTQTELMKEFYYVDLLESLACCWQDYAHDGGDELFAGAGGVLRNVECILREHALLLENGDVDWDKIETLTWANLNT